MCIQCQRRILKQHLKVPPALHQFTRTLDKNLGIYETCLFIRRWTRNPQCLRSFSCCAVLF
uniref:Uncharacterized protein n=1 Tax=Aegilops tauschii subsp. strangulata TaxID=200361 RepID=A0A453HWD1_AEGTS